MFLRLDRKSSGKERLFSFFDISEYASSALRSGWLKGNSKSVSSGRLSGMSSGIRFGTMKRSISNLNSGSYMRGVFVYWNTALNPTPNFPIEASVLVELAIEVMEFMSPRCPCSESSSSLAGSETEKCLAPSCANISRPCSRINLAFTACASSAFCRSS